MAEIFSRSTSSFSFQGMSGASKDAMMLTGSPAEEPGVKTTRSTESFSSPSSLPPIPQSANPFFHIAAVDSATSATVLFSRRALLASIQGSNSVGDSPGKVSSRLVRSPLGSMRIAGMRCRAASSIKPIHKPVLPEPVMPVTRAWVVKSGGS